MGWKKKQIEEVQIIMSCLDGAAGGLSYLSRSSLMTIRGREGRVSLVTKRVEIERLSRLST